MYLDNVLMQALIVLLGLLVGSFLNVVIYRLPIMMAQDEKAMAWEILNPEEDPQKNPYLQERFNLAFPPSACPKCGHKIRAWENIPIVSYFIQKRCCISCKEPISPRYVLVEALTGFLTFLVVLKFDDLWALVFALIFTWILIALFFIDAETMLLPDNLTLPLMWLGFIASLKGLFVPISYSVLSAIIGYLSLWVVFWIFKLITGRDGMGYGDFKILAALLAWQGFVNLPLLLTGAALSGLIVGVINKVGFGKPMPFGPFLIGSGWIFFMYGENFTKLMA